MSKEQRTLDYAPGEVRERWWRHPILWTLLSLNMWGCAIMGATFPLLGFASLFSPIGGMSLFGRPVETRLQRVEWIAVNAATATVGIIFIVVEWNRRKTGHSCSVSTLSAGP